MWDTAKFTALWEGWNERIANFRIAVRPFRKRIAMFLAIVGPGLIVSNVDNDAGGIYVYSQSGAKYGYMVLWTLIPMTIALYVSLEMCSRMGAHTGKGLSVLVVKLANVLAVFAGVASPMEVFGIRNHISVPMAAVLLSLLVVRGSGARL